MTTPPEVPPSTPSPFSLAKDDQTWAMVAHAVTFIEGGIVGPLLLYVVMKDKSEFIAFHALQSFYFGLLVLAVSVLSCGLLALPAAIVYVVFEIIACVRALEGQWYRLPWAGDMAWRKHHL